MNACTSMAEPLCTSYTTVLESLLADCRANNPNSASIRRANMSLRNWSVPSLAIRAKAYCAPNCATPRSTNINSTTAGTVHNGSVPSPNPRSSNGLSMAGMAASVSAPTSVASTAYPHSRGCREKYALTRRNRASRLPLGAAAAREEESGEDTINETMGTAKAQIAKPASIVERLKACIASEWPSTWQYGQYSTMFPHRVLYSHSAMNADILDKEKIRQDTRPAQPSDRLK